ncbi:metal-sensitive transcriptional regulator [Nocardioides ginkgobilobae]
MDDLTRSSDPSPVVNRVKRAQGQLAGVLRMVEEGRQLDDVLNQLKAVTRALERAGFAMITADLRRQVANGEDITESDLDTYERHFLSLS